MCMPSGMEASLAMAQNTLCCWMDESRETVGGILVTTVD